MQSYQNVKTSSLAILPWLLRLIAGTLFMVVAGGAFASSIPAVPSVAQAPVGAGCQPWALVVSPNPRTHHYLNAIDVISSNDVWAVGEYYDEYNYTRDTGLTMHWDGTAWSIVPTPQRGQRVRLMGVSAVASNDVWAVGLYYPGGAYESIAMHWDGTSWSIVPTPPRVGGTELRAVVALSSNDVWAVGANDGSHSTITMHWDGTSWSIVPSPNIGTQDNVLTSVTAISPNDIWAAGYIQPESGASTSITMRWNGSQWSTVATPNPGNYSRRLKGITALASNDIWAVGNYSSDLGSTYLPLFLHWNGTQWTHVSSPNVPNDSFLYAVHAIAPNDIWAVGSNAPCDFCDFDTLIMHWDGTTWTRVASPNGFRDLSNLNGVAAVSPDEVWAVGYTDRRNYPYTSDSLILHLVCEQGSPTPSATRTQTPVSTATSSPQATTSTHTSTPGSTSIPTNTQPPITSIPTNTPPPPSTPTAFTSTSTPALATSTSTPALATSTITPALATSTATPARTASTVASATAPVRTATPTVCSIGFSDVPPDHTFHAFVRCLTCASVLGGYNDGTFRPGNPITRGQIAKVVSNAAGYSETPSGQTYQDVSTDNTFYMWIERLSVRGHMGGYPCGGPGEPCVQNRPYFRPFANATRGQLSKIVSNAANLGGTPSGQFYTDVPESHPFYLWIMRLTAQGAMSGYTCGGPGEPCDGQRRPYFRPYNDVTRGQASKIVANTFFPSCQTPSRNK